MKLILTVSLLLALSLNTMGQVVKVTDFGATPDDPSDNDKSAIAVAISKCRKYSNEGKSPILFFTKGVYHIEENPNSPIFEVSNIDNLTIQGAGSMLMIRGKKYPENKPIFFFQNCKNLSIKNLEVDYESLPWSQGKIVNTGEDFMDIRLLKGEGFDIEDKEIKAYALYDSIQGQQISYKESYGKSPWEWLDKSKNIIRVADNKKGYSAGSYIALRHALYNNNTFIIYSGCEDVLFENINVYACSGYPFNAYASKNLTFLNCNILRKSDQHWITSTADGAHLLDVRGEVKFENCYFENMCDDGINLHGYFQEINEFSSSTISVAGKEKHKWYTAHSFAEGDKIIIVDAETQQTVSRNAIKKIASKNGNAMTIKLETKFDFDDSKTYKMANISTIGKLTVRNCTFKKNRARGMLVSSIDATIENCTFERTLMTGILFEVSNYWIESTPAMNTVIRNNTFINCGFARESNKKGTIDLEAQITTEDKTPIEDVFKNISIYNNTFKDTKTPIVNAYHVDGLKIKNNKIENPGEWGNQIRYSECKNTEISNNGSAVAEKFEGRITKH